MLFLLKDMVDVNRTGQSTLLPDQRPLIPSKLALIL